MDFGHLWGMTSLLVVSSILAVIANALLLLVFFKRRGLRTISNRFVINLLVTNLLSSLLLVPLLVFDRRSSQTQDGATENSTVASIYNISETITNIIIDEKIVDTPEFIEIDINISENITGTHTNLNYFMCYFTRTITNLVCTASIFSILLIGVDQYFAVIHALRYHSYIDKFKSSMLLISCWLFSITIAALDLVISPDLTFWLCCSEGDFSRNTKLKLSYSILYFLTVILLPFCTICIIYFCIYFAARKNSERMRRSTSTANTNLTNNHHNASYSQLPIAKESSDDSLSDIKELPKVHSAPNIINLENLTENKRVARTPSDRRNLIITIKTKLSNASVFRYRREETRAARISILVIFMVLICYFPYGFAVIISNVVTIPNFNYLSLLLLILSNAISPFLFAYRNKRIRREFLKFMGLLRKKQTSESPVRSPVRRRSSLDAVDNDKQNDAVQPFLAEQNFQIPKVVISCKVENEKQSILKRVYSKTYKKCNFIAVPDSCLDARGSVSSASTQISTDE